MVEAMKDTPTSFNRAQACTAAPTAPDPTAGRHWPTPRPETTGHSRASLGHFLVGSLLFSPSSWFAEGFVCALRQSVFPSLA